MAVPNSPNTVQRGNTYVDTTQWRTYGGKPQLDIKHNGIMDLMGLLIQMIIGVTQLRMKMMKMMMKMMMKIIMKVIILHIDIEDGDGYYEEGKDGDKKSEDIWSYLDRMAGN